FKVTWSELAAGGVDFNQIRLKALDVKRMFAVAVVGSHKKDIGRLSDGGRWLWWVLFKLKVIIDELLFGGYKEQRWWLGSNGKVRLRWSVGDGGGLLEMVVVIIGGGGWE
nr:hypothetical protein [Tanacetum cinerariifolium]